jgi:hypothetical protein
MYGDILHQECNGPVNTQMKNHPPNPSSVSDSEKSPEVPSKKGRLGQPLSMTPIPDLLKQPSQESQNVVLHLRGHETVSHKKRASGQLRGLAATIKKGSSKKAPSTDFYGG